MWLGIRKRINKFLILGFVAIEKLFVKSFNRECIGNIC